MQSHYLTHSLCTHNFSFAVDETKLVLIPKNSSIIKAGGIVMTEIDKSKLKNAYGCTTCGGHQFSSSGGSLEAASTFSTSSCEWILRTEKMKQIVMDFSVSIWSQTNIL